MGQKKRGETVGEYKAGNMEGSEKSNQKKGDAIGAMTERGRKEIKWRGR